MTTGIELVRPPGLTGSPSHAAVTDPGRMIFTAGACPLDARGATVAPGDVAGQTRQAVDNLVAALEASGAGLTDVLKTTVYVATADREDLLTARDVLRSTFGEHTAPSTLVGVTLLAHPGQLVEVEAVAVRDSWQEPAPPHDGSTVSA